MHVVGLIVIAALALAALLLAASWAAFALEPETRVTRALRQALGRDPDATLVVGPPAAGLGLVSDPGIIALAPRAGGPGLTFELRELIGVELIFDGVVAARLFRGEPRRALDNLSPGAESILLRLVFDDLDTPEFELEILGPARARRKGADPAAQALIARRWYARLEAAVRRGSDGPGARSPGPGGSADDRQDA